jgi:nucleoid-associated protein YgaU
MRYQSPVYRRRRRCWMGRDKVLGLSLAILVIGIAAAFCFRNEQFVESGLKLARANVLDEAISKLPGPKPYTQDAKPRKPKPSLPTVTLNGIESADPFADAHTSPSRSQDPEKIAKAVDKPKPSPPVKLAAADNTTSKLAEMPAIDTRPAADSAMASIDTEKAAPEINTSKPSSAPAFPADKPSSDPSTLLTSTAPPVTEPSSDDNPPSVGQMVIRPAASASRPKETVKEHNVSLRTKPAEERHEAIADNSPRPEPANDELTGDDPHRQECTRDNPTRDVPGLAPRKEENGSESASENPIHDTPVAIDSPGTDKGSLNPTGDTPAPETANSPKPVLHRVRRGDMLTKIALHYFGDSRRYREIFEANRDQLKTPNDRLKIGMMLRIPANTAPQARKESPIHRENTVTKRKPRSGRTGRSAIGTTGGSKIPVHNAARLREKPPSEPTEQPPSATSDDQGMTADKSSTNRFVPVKRAPFLPGRKTVTDQTPETGKPQSTDPATSDRSTSSKDPITLAGDREDATIR